MPYAILFLITIAIAPIFKCRAYNTLTAKNETKYKISYYLIVGVLLCLFVGLRGMDVGSDTRTYLWHFNTLKNMNFATLFSVYGTDLGFFLFTDIIARLTNNDQLYLIIVAAIYLGSVLLLIKRKSNNPVWSLFLFYCFGLFTFCLSTIRQSIAMSFCILTYLSLDKSKKRAIAFSLIAATFHYSSLVFLPVIFLDKIKVTRKTVSLLTFVSVLLYFTSGNLAGVLNRIASANANKEYVVGSVGGTGMFLFLLVLAILQALIYLYHSLDQNDSINVEANRCVIITFITAIVFAASRINVVVMRLYYYYFVFIVISIPNYISYIKLKNNKLIIGTVISLVAVYFLVFQVFVSPGSPEYKLLPYYFFWQN